MENNYEDGYWVRQLTDEQAKEILMLLSELNTKKTFKKIINIERFKNVISILYLANRPKRYIHFSDDTLEIEDFKLFGFSSHASHVIYYQYMIDLFGVEYAEDLLNYADEYIENYPEKTWSKKLIKLKDAVQNYIQDLKASQNI
ncbi:MAG: hypothetical protein IJ415_01355 [Clostridia bacterium]|nr:hypothetical protein [Clostridia bacterium]